ncbi:MAG: hypothetical protein M0P01_05980 [Treponema sp.]|nr:hypothetical protein [Treponema sp.]
MNGCILPVFLTALVLTGCGTQSPAYTSQTYTGSRTAGHEAVAAYDRLTAEQKNAAVSLKTYFEHASVGRNILNGVQKLIADGVELEWPDYSHDSGHMNADDYDLRPAKVLITLLARIGTSD